MTVDLDVAICFDLVPDTKVAVEGDAPVGLDVSLDLQRPLEDYRALAVDVTTFSDVV